MANYKYKKLWPGFRSYLPAKVILIIIGLIIVYFTASAFYPDTSIIQNYSHYAKKIMPSNYILFGSSNYTENIGNAPCVHQQYHINNTRQALYKQFYSLFTSQGYRSVAPTQYEDGKYFDTEMYYNDLFGNAFLDIHLFNPPSIEVSFYPNDNQGDATNVNYHPNVTEVDINWCEIDG